MSLPEIISPVDREEGHRVGVLNERERVGIHGRQTLDRLGQRIRQLVTRPTQRCASRPDQGRRITDERVRTPIGLGEDLINRIF